MFTIIRRIGAITRAIQKDSNHVFRPSGLNNNLFLYIIRVCEQPGLFMGELADQLHVDRTTSFRAIQKLVKKELLELQADPNNQKIRRIFPTKKAMAIYPQLHDYESKQSQKLLSKLTPEEQEELKRLLQKLTL